MECLEKQSKTEENELKGMLLSMQSSFINKLKNIEDKIEGFNSKYHLLEGRIESMLLKVKESTTTGSDKVAYPSGSVSEKNDLQTPEKNKGKCDIYPSGSWLGNPNSSEQRVRCHLEPKELENINNMCTSADKMALTLLDHLFDRETQARSNISGTGKHGKEQLDPLKIYGIKCHVNYMFGVNNKEWLRIRQNIDSKCRTAFRRKQKGLSLNIKGCRDRSSRPIPKQPQQVVLHDINGDVEYNTLNLLQDNIHQNLLIPKIESQTVEFLQENNLAQIIPLKLEPDGCSLTFADTGGTQVIHTEHGDIQVIQATKEQLELLKSSHQIEILSPADILPDSILGLDS